MLCHNSFLLKVFSKIGRFVWNRAWTGQRAHGFWRGAVLVRLGCCGRMPYTEQLRHNTVLFLIVLGWEVQNSTKPYFLLSLHLCAEEFSRLEYSWPFVKKQEGSCIGREKGRNKIFRYLRRAKWRVRWILCVFLSFLLPLTSHPHVLMWLFLKGERRESLQRRIPKAPDSPSRDSSSVFLIGYSYAYMKDIVHALLCRRYWCWQRLILFF